MDTHHGNQSITPIVAIVVMRQDKKILLLQRSKQRCFYPGEWGVISGHIEKDESAKEAAVRELLEETGLSENDLVSINPDRVGQPFVVSSAKLGQEKLLVYPYLFRVKSNNEKNDGKEVKIRISKEHCQYRWINPRDLYQFVTLQQTRQDLTRLLVLPRKKIIGVVGRNASGKDTCIQTLASFFDVYPLNISDQVRQIAGEQGKALTRDNLHQISDYYIHTVDSEFFSKRTLLQIEKRCLNNVAISGIRTVDNVSTFRHFYGEDFILLYVETKSDKTRFKRMQSRKAVKDPKNWQEFKDQEKNEEKIFQISKTIALADITIRNNSAESDFVKQIRCLGEEMGLSVRRDFEEQRLLVDKTRESGADSR